MSMRLYVSQTTVSHLKLIRRTRMLPGQGEIMVRAGDRVDPVQVIGKARVPSDFRIVNVARSLAVPLRTVSRYITVEVGERVEKGDVLARKGRVGKRVCRAPITGLITGIGGGRVLIEGPSDYVEVRSGYYGKVTRVYANEGVEIEISGALIQGAWGNGQEGFGVLQVVVQERDRPLKARAVDAASRGVILVGGSHLDHQALERAEETQVRGIIVGGIPPELVTRIKTLSFPVVATEGIGTIPMASPLFDLFSTHDGREVMVDGRFESGREAVYPEVMVPLAAEPGTDQLRLVDAPLKVGDRVRVGRAPHVGVVGTVVELPERIFTMTGIHLPVARVQPEGEDGSFLVPVLNLEVLV